MCPNRLSPWGDQLRFFFFFSGYHFVIANICYVEAKIQLFNLCLLYRTIELINVLHCKPLNLHNHLFLPLSIVYFEQHTLCIYIAKVRKSYTATHIVFPVTYVSLQALQCISSPKQIKSYITYSPYHMSSLSRVIQQLTKTDKIRVPLRLFSPQSLYINPRTSW